jgi:hypothetical protein
VIGVALGVAEVALLEDLPAFFPRHAVNEIEIKATKVALKIH